MGLGRIQRAKAEIPDLRQARRLMLFWPVEINVYAARVPFYADKFRSLRVLL